MRLSIRVKLFLVVGLLLVPLGLMSWLFVGQSFKDIDFAAAELAGTEQMNQLRADLARFGLELPQPSAALVASTVAALTQPGLPDAVRGAAEALSKKAESGDPAALAAGFRDLATAVGNESNLILDPDLDSFYVMDSLVVRLPDLIGRVAALEAFVRTRTGAGAFDEEARLLLTTELAQIQAAAATVEASTATAIEKNADGSVAPLLRGPTDRLTGAAQAFEAAAKALSAASRASGRIEDDAFAAFSAARLALATEADKTFIAASTSMEQLLSARIGRFETRLWSMLGIAFAVTLAAIAFAVVISRSIVAAIDRLDARIRDLGDADLGADIVEARGTDEIAKLARAVAYFRDRTVERLQEANSEEKQREIRQRERRALAGVADRLTQTVGHVVRAIEKLAERVHGAVDTVGSNATQTRTRLSESVERLARASGDMSVVVSAVTELSSSIAEISGQTNRSARDAAEARHRADAARSLGARLVTSSARIGDVSTLIADIAEQTNLLALNATIEAARAGVAGKGFAVVAAEVKQLADQTAKATLEIKRQVEDIRGASDEMTASIEGVSQSIAAMSGLTTAIAGAVEEQSAATSEITASLDRTAHGTETVVSTLGELPTLATGTETAARELDELSRTLVEEIRALDRQVNDLLSDLSDNRRHARQQTAISADAQIGGRFVRCTIVDVSRSGMRVTGLGDVAVGTPVDISIPGVRRATAEVIWRSEGVAGVAFRGTLLTDAEIEALAARKAA